MAAKIEHHAKKHAYMKCYTWGQSDVMDKKSMLYHDKVQYEKHVSYCDDMETTGQHYYGSPPRSVFLNWLGHKILEAAWGKERLY